jgi:hypothetical protein
MPNHLHTDILTLSAAAFFTLLVAHTMRALGAVAARNLGMDTLGKAWGAFWSLPA